MLATLLLAWYDQHKRTLSFRGTKDPYRIWVSEIMLQQTRTATVEEYYRRFMARFPDVFSLAEADEQDVLKYWEGLGYYSRARNLHKTAKIVASEYDGTFPRDVDALRALPGVGDYTAAAVASIAFDVPAPAMDGNLTRVLSRFHGVREDVGAPSVKRRLMDLARQDMPPVRCGDFNQALMDLGANVCVPGTPSCFLCPLRTLCDACRAGDAEDLPVKEKQKPPKEIQLAVALVTWRDKIWMTERRESLLKGLWVYALLENAGTPREIEKSLKALGIQAQYQSALPPARHVFTHRVWNMTLHHLEADGPACRQGRFVTYAEMQALPMPTAMRAAKSIASLLLHPSIQRVEKEEEVPPVAQVYAESWQAAHAWRCDADFVAQHTPERMAEALRAHRAAGREVYGLWLKRGRKGPSGVMVLDRAENELVCLYIHPACQRMGIGTAAVQFAVSALDEARDMKLTVLQDNVPALGLYERFGFCHVRDVRVLNAEKNIVEETRVRPAFYASDQKRMEGKE